MLALRKALAALFLVFATVAFALTPGERVVLFSGIKPVWQANFLGASSLPAGLTWTVPTTLRTLYDSTGKLTYGGNNLILQSQTLSTSPWSTGGVSTLTPGITAPDGTSTAFQITYLAGGSRITQQIASIPAPSLIYSVYLKVASVDNGATLLVYDNTAGSTLTSLTVNTIAGSGIDAGNGWRRVYLALSPIVGHNLTFYVYTDKSNGAIVGSSLYAWGAQVEAVTYQTTPSAYNATTSAAYYAPRFDYDPSTLAPRGLLVEEQRVQYAQYSQNFGTGWTSPGGATTITTASGVTSPDGTSQMALLTQTNTSGLIYGNSTGLTTTGTNYVSSGYFKAGASSPAPYFEIAFTDVSGSYAIAYFNSSTGAYVTSAAARGSIVSYGSTLISNGIWRCWVVASFTTITTGLRSLLNVASDTSGNTVAGQTGYVWGAQVEAGSFPTSYIPNATASTVTRTADVVQFNGVPLAAGAGTSGTAIVQITDAAVQASTSTPLLGNATSNGPLYFTTSYAARTWNGTNFITTANTATFTNPNRAAIAWSPAGRSIVLNGSTVVTDANGISAPSVLGANQASGGTLWLNGHLASTSFYNQRLPDPTLKAKSVVGAPY